LISFKEAADTLEEERIRRFEIDRGVRAIVVRFSPWFKPAQLPELIYLGYWSKVAIAAGWDDPRRVFRRRLARRPDVEPARPDGPDSEQGYETEPDRFEDEAGKMPTSDS
jgi:hypothetical protein